MDGMSGICIFISLSILHNFVLVPNLAVRIGFRILCPSGRMVRTPFISRLIEEFIAEVPT